MLRLLRSQILAVVVMATGHLAAQSGHPAVAQRLVVSYDRFGPVKIGMTAAQAAKALRVRVTRDAGYDGDECYYTSPKGGFTDIAFMMQGTRIVRIDIDSKLYATELGAKIGDTEARIKRLYRGKFKVHQHKYFEAGHYIEVGMDGGKFSILFETDGKRVTTYRIGKPEQVGYVEGCS